MLGVLVGNIKGYLFAAGGIIMTVFAAMFAYRGKKIESQQKEIDQANVDKVRLESAVTVQKEMAEKAQKANEILSEVNDVNAAAKRLRERAKNRNGNKD